MSPIRPQELTMAARTVTRTTRHVNGKGHLIGELLKNNICIYIMKHYYLTLNDKTHSRSRGYIHPHNSVPLSYRTDDYLAYKDIKKVLNTAEFMLKNEKINKRHRGEKNKKRNTFL